ncbi:MAG: hypothetical protein RMJ43_13795 [Chloroherpetonaceae bacterium]|nr:hypothetical protein [Chthonomonadaceae bacterium]MDW8208902.1 hypothetical protein [Chloroherpetonaceae bacterium]
MVSSVWIARLWLPAFLLYILLPFGATVCHCGRAECRFSLWVALQRGLTFPGSATPRSERTAAYVADTGCHCHVSARAETPGICPLALSASSDAVAFLPFLIAPALTPEPAPVSLRGRISRAPPVRHRVFLSVALRAPPSLPLC